MAKNLRSFSFSGGNTIERLKAGNEYFTSYTLKKASASNMETVKNLAVYGQNPHAVIVTCSDARISPERIFCAEMGDFFIIRTAGNVVGPLEIGSIEYAILEMKADTIIVMGHESCGAIKNATEVSEDDMCNIQCILDEIKPSIEKAKKEAKSHIDFIVKAEDYNIFNTLDKIKNSKIVSKAIEKGKVTLVGAKYGIVDGKVTFF